MRSCENFLYDLGIPGLDPSLQPTEQELRSVWRWTKWSERWRPDAFLGRGVHFYCWDHYFTAVWNEHRRAWHLEQASTHGEHSAAWKHPDSVARSGATIAVEANYSTWPDQPFAEAVWATYRKRVLAAHWQRQGVKVVVDLNVAPADRYHELNLVGVPRGWIAYATRYHADQGLDGVHHDFEVAARHASPNAPAFVLFGGGDRAKRWCERWGWIHGDDGYRPKKRRPAVAEDLGRGEGRGESQGGQPRRLADL